MICTGRMAAVNSAPPKMRTSAGPSAMLKQAK